MSDSATVQLSPYLTGIYGTGATYGRFGIAGAVSLAVDGKSIGQPSNTVTTTTDSNGNVSISLYGQLSQLLDSFHTDLKSSSAPAYSAGVSDLSVASARITGTVNAASLASISVTQLAQAQTLLSTTFDQAATKFGYGSLTLETGRYDSSSHSFTPSTSNLISLPANGASLQMVADAINQSGAPVKATIVQSSSGAQLQLQSTQTGSANTMRLLVNDQGDGNSTDNQGLSQLAFNPAAAQGSGQNLTVSQPAQDAIYSIDGNNKTSSSNTVADLIPGVTVTLNQTGTFSLSTSTPFSGILQTANGIVSAYNKYVDSLDKLNANAGNNGQKNTSDTPSSQASQLSGNNNGLTDWLKQQKDNLSQIGIGWQDKTGKLQLNDSQLYSQWNDTPIATRKSLLDLSSGLLSFGSGSLAGSHPIPTDAQNSIGQYYLNNSGLGT